MGEGIEWGRQEGEGVSGQMGYDGGGGGGGGGKGRVRLEARGREGERQAEYANKRLYRVRAYAD